MEAHCKLMEAQSKQVLSSVFFFFVTYPISIFTSAGSPCVDKLERKNLRVHRISLQFLELYYLNNFGLNQGRQYVFRALVPTLTILGI